MPHTEIYIKICTLREDSMDVFAYHRYPKAGKYRTVPCKPLRHAQDLSLAYSPGVAQACEAIVQNPEAVNELTIRKQLVAVISNGTAVLGLGNIGPLAAKPVMEGKAVLFQKFAHLNAIDLEINESDPHKLIDIIVSLAPSFGGINLEDIKAPDCFLIEQEVQKRLSIPVFHDDQHGTAITVTAALLNALFLIKKDVAQVRCVVSGAGAGALACLQLLEQFGLKRENVFLFDSKGLIHHARTDLSSHKSFYAQAVSHFSLSEALQGADVFLGLSASGILTGEMVATMGTQPIIFALANPDPEIFPHVVFQVRTDALVGTGRSDYPNQVNNLLCFPYIFRGALDAGAPYINLAMKKACVNVLMQLARHGFSDILDVYDEPNVEFGTSYFIPKPFDVRLLTEIPVAVAKEAIESGIARPFCLKTYHKELISQAYQEMPALRAAMLHQNPTSHHRVIFYEGVTPVVLNTAQTLARYGLAKAGFIGPDASAIEKILTSYPLLKESVVITPADVLPSYRCLRQAKGSMYTSGNASLGNDQDMQLMGVIEKGAAFFGWPRHCPLTKEWLLTLQKMIKYLGWEPYFVHTASLEGTDLAPFTEEDPLFIHPRMPALLEDNIGYVLIDAPVSMIYPTIGPFHIENSLSQEIMPKACLRDTIERAAFTLWAA